MLFSFIYWVDVLEADFMSLIRKDRVLKCFKEECLFLVFSVPPPYPGVTPSSTPAFETQYNMTGSGRGRESGLGEGERSLVGTSCYKGGGRDTSVWHRHAGRMDQGQVCLECGPSRMRGCLSAVWVQPEEKKKITHTHKKFEYRVFVTPFVSIGKSVVGSWLM